MLFRAFRVFFAAFSWVWGISWILWYSDCVTSYIDCFFCCTRHQLSSSCVHHTSFTQQPQLLSMHVFLVWWLLEHAWLNMFMLTHANPDTQKILNPEWIKHVMKSSLSLSSSTSHQTAAVNSTQTQSLLFFLTFKTVFIFRNTFLTFSWPENCFQLIFEDFGAHKDAKSAVYIQVTDVIKEFQSFSVVTLSDDLSSHQTQAEPSTVASDAWSTSLDSSSSLGCDSECVDCW